MDWAGIAVRAVCHRAAIRPDYLRSSHLVRELAVTIGSRGSLVQRSRRWLVRLEGVKKLTDVHIQLLLRIRLSYTVHA
jgi:hypothetical protein